VVDVAKTGSQPEHFVTARVYLNFYPAVKQAHPLKAPFVFFRASAEYSVFINIPPSPHPVKFFFYKTELTHENAQ
jgi:hypothetical protein